MSLRATWPPSRPKAEPTSQHSEVIRTARGRARAKATLDWIVSAMKAKGFVITAGYGDAKDAMIRIGHMGEHTLAELEVLLGALDEVLAS